jgi:DNA-binding LytR/AlgR family response regulator
MKDLGPVGFVRIHRNHAVHPGRIREIRPDADGSGYEVRLEPPVNKVLPVSRRLLATLLRAYGATAAGEGASVRQAPGVRR